MRRITSAIGFGVGLACAAGWGAGLGCAGKSIDADVGADSSGGGANGVGGLEAGLNVILTKQ